MFKLADPDQTYSYPVTINVPAGDGKTTPQEFTAQFKLLPANEIKKLMEDDIKFSPQSYLAGRVSLITPENHSSSTVQIIIVWRKSAISL